MSYFRYLLLPMACFLCLSCSQPKELVYQDVRNFRVHKADLQQVTLVMDLRFYNPNNYGLSLKEGDMDAYFNDKFLGKAVLDEKTAIPAKDTFLIPVTITANLSALFSNALDMLTSQDMLVRLQGTVKVGKGGVFIKVPVHYEGRQRISL